MSIGTGSFVVVADFIPKRLSRVDLVNEVTIAGHDARLHCYGVEEDDTINWWIFNGNTLRFHLLGFWRPNGGGQTYDNRYFFNDRLSDTLHIKGAATADVGIYLCKTEGDSESSYGHLTILSMHAI